jgi:hypothetical protein
MKSSDKTQTAVSALDRIEQALRWGDFDGWISWDSKRDGMVGGCIAHPPTELEDLRTDARAALADLREELERLEQFAKAEADTNVALHDEVERLEAALREIAYAKERQPVTKTTGVSGEPRFLHSWPSRSVALAALGGGGET